MHGGGINNGRHGMDGASFESNKSSHFALGAKYMTLLHVHVEFGFRLDSSTRYRLLELFEIHPYPYP